MKSIIFLAFFAALGGCASGAGTRVQPEVEAYGLRVRALPVRVPLLWKIRRGTAESYLYGTIHAGVQLSRVPVIVRFKLHDARLAFFETTRGDDTGEAEGGGLSDVWNNPRLTSRGGDLPFRISRRAWDTLLARSGVPGTLLKHLTPTSAAVLLEINETEMCDDRPCEPSLIDAELEAEARARSIPTRALDNTTLIAEAMESVEVTAEELDHWLADEARFNNYLRKTYRLLEAYKLGRVDELIEHEGDGAAPRFANDALLKNRNAFWLRALVLELEKGGVFVAVGAAHMPGTDGLVELLRQRGFLVTLVK